MREGTREEFVSALKCGDIGVCLGNSIFSKLQNWYRKFVTKEPEKASHGFYLKTPPSISEADGWKVNGGNSIERYFSDHHKIWVFRHKGLNEEQLDDMNEYVSGAEDCGGIYSWAGISQFGKRFILKLFGKTCAITDKRGVFCTEYTSKIILAGDLKPYITDKFPYEIDPSTQLSWLEDEGVKSGAWEMIASYDKGKFFVL